MIVLAILPSIVLFYFVWKGDRYEKEPAGLLLKLFLFGLLTTISASIIEIIFSDHVFGFLKPVVLLYAFIDCFLVTAVAEEAGKYFVLKKVTWKHPAFNYTFDAVVYSVAVSLGFATLENILYLLEASVGTAVMRALLSVPGHVIDAIYMGYYYGLARHAAAYNDERLKKKYLKRAFIVPVLIHGFYDFCLSTDNGFFILIFFVFEIVITVMAIRKFRTLSRVEATIPGNTDQNRTVLPKAEGRRPEADDERKQRP